MSHFTFFLRYIVSHFFWIWMVSGIPYLQKHLKGPKWLRVVVGVRLMPFYFIFTCTILVFLANIYLLIFSSPRFCCILQLVLHLEVFVIFELHLYFSKIWNIYFSFLFFWSIYSRVCCICTVKCYKIKYTYNWIYLVKLYTYMEAEEDVYYTY